MWLFEFTQEVLFKFIFGELVTDRLSSSNWAAYAILNAFPTMEFNPSA